MLGESETWPINGYVCILCALIRKQDFLNFISVYLLWDDAMVLLLGHRSRDSQVTGSSPGWASLHSGFVQATYTCVPLSSSSIIWYQPRDIHALQLGK